MRFKSEKTYLHLLSLYNPLHFQIFERDRTADLFWFCNNFYIPVEGETKSNVMFVHFVTDHKIAGAGFQLSYIWVEGTFLSNEPRCEKTCVRGFRPCPTQTGLQPQKMARALKFQI